MAIILTALLVINTLPQMLLMDQNFYEFENGKNIFKKQFIFRQEIAELINPTG